MIVSIRDLENHFFEGTIDTKMHIIKCGEKRNYSPHFCGEKSIYLPQISFL